MVRLTKANHRTETIGVHFSARVQMTSSELLDLLSIHVRYRLNGCESGFVPLYLTGHHNRCLAQSPPPAYPTPMPSNKRIVKLNGACEPIPALSIAHGLT